MNLNELIKKYEEKIVERKKAILFIEGTELHILTDDLLLNYQEVLQDLKQLKEIIGE